MREVFLAYSSKHRTSLMEVEINYSGPLFSGAPGPATSESQKAGIGEGSKSNEPLSQVA